MKRIRLIGRLLAVAVVLSAASYETGLGQDASKASGPAESPRSDVIHLGQGWDQETAQWWYHVSQGTVIMPAEWFVSLAQASGDAPFASPDHLARLGFIPDPASSENPLGLPVGFAVRDLDFPDTDAQHFQSVWKGKWVGFACAACHTGQLNYNGQRIRIDGGPAHLNLEGFHEDLAMALAATESSEPKFEQFAARVRAHGANVSPEDLRKQFELFLRDQAATNSLIAAGQAMASEESTSFGPGRLDASHVGGNSLLAASLMEIRNVVPTTAPVRFPMLWDTPYFDWVLYNASVRQPLARNIVEALATGSPIDPRTFLSGDVNHGVLLDNVVQIHRALTKLESPSWPEDVLGKIDQAKADQGRVVFEQRCAACHSLIDRSRHVPLSGAASTGATITIPLVPLEVVGTDPRQAQNFATRVITLEKVGGPGKILYYKAAELLTGRIVDQFVKQSLDNAQAEQEIDTGRPDEFRGPAAYRARPLNGLWAAPPYLHNGSVPSLYELLLPAAHRTRLFYVGAWEFDPEKVGLVVGSPFPGAFTFDTRLPGNSNAGHEYGTDLSDSDRWALVEYLKTL